MRSKLRIMVCVLGSGPRYQILSHVFARCASLKTHGHARIARDTQARETQYTSGHCLVRVSGPSFLSGPHRQTAGPIPSVSAVRAPSGAAPTSRRVRRASSTRMPADQSRRLRKWVWIRFPLHGRPVRVACVRGVRKWARKVCLHFQGVAGRRAWRPGGRVAGPAECRPRPVLLSEARSAGSYRGRLCGSGPPAACRSRHAHGDHERWVGGLG